MGRPPKYDWDRLTDGRTHAVGVAPGTDPRDLSRLYAALRMHARRNDLPLAVDQTHGPGGGPVLLFRFGGDLDPAAAVPETLSAPTLDRIERALAAAGVPVTRSRSALRVDDTHLLAVTGTSPLGEYLLDGEDDGEGEAT